MEKSKSPIHAQNFNLRPFSRSSYCFSSLPIMSYPYIRPGSRGCSASVTGYPSGTAKKPLAVPPMPTIPEPPGSHRDD